MHLSNKMARGLDIQNENKFTCFFCFVSFWAFPFVSGQQCPLTDFRFSGLMLIYRKGQGHQGIFPCTGCISEEPLFEHFKGNHHQWQRRQMPLLPPKLITPSYSRASSIKGRKLTIVDQLAILPGSRMYFMHM